MFQNGLCRDIAGAAGAGPIMSEIRDDIAAGRLEFEEAGHVVFARYSRVDGGLIIEHVEADPALRGTGASGRFMEALVADVRRRGLKITPVCGWAALWLRRHPQYGDVVAAPALVQTSAEGVRPSSSRNGSA